MCNEEVPKLPLMGQKNYQTEIAELLQEKGHPNLILIYIIKNKLSESNLKTL